MAERAQGTGAVQLVAEQGGARVESRLDLLERDAELAALEELIGGAGQARLLAIVGPPGIGKTSLIQEARLRGHAAGMLVLGARGSELERRFSFGVVRQLFEPFLVRLSEEERSEFLVGAAGLSLPVFEPDVLTAEPAAESSLSLLHGLYWLAANLTTLRPLLLVVDDLHWSDLPSLRWLAYLLPRLDGLEVSLVVALRPKEAGEAPELLSQIVSDPEATVVEPAPLSSAASARIMREALSPGADDAFCAACHEITGGNPLLLRELRNGILAEEVAPARARSPCGLSRSLGAPLPPSARGDQPRAGGVRSRRRGRASTGRRARRARRGNCVAGAGRPRACRHSASAAPARVRPPADTSCRLRHAYPGRARRRAHTRGTPAH
jgi:AAA ATPase domain